MNEVDKGLGRSGPCYSRTDQEIRAAAEGEKLNNTAEPNLRDWFRAIPFSASRGVVLVVHGVYGIPTLCRPLPCPYHCFHTNTFYSNKLHTIENTQSER